MDIDQLVHMDDGEFEQCVSQAIKRRGDFPRWWAACLHADVIDDTEEVVNGFIETGTRQAQDPDKYPYAKGFVAKMRGVRAEIRLQRITEEG